MQDFINYVYNFVTSIFYSIRTAINTTAYSAFLDKNIINGTLININLTYSELFLYISTWFLVIFFIVFIFKLVFKVINLICLR